MYGNVTARRDDMEGKRRRGIERERPIAKPDYPLPALFSTTKRSELATRRGREKNESPKVERAHFYRKQTSESGSPVYGFFITDDRAEPPVRKD